MFMSRPGPKPAGTGYAGLECKRKSKKLKYNENFFSLSKCYFSLDSLLSLPVASKTKLVNHENRCFKALKFSPKIPSPTETFFLI